MFRSSLVIVLALGVVGFLARASLGQPLSPLEYGVYDFTGVGAEAGAALAQDRISYTELLLTTMRLERELHLSPDYKAAAADVEQAHNDLDNARNPILAVVASDPRYQQLSSEYNNVASVLSQGGLSERDLRDLAEQKMRYGTEMRKMEADALNADANVQSARQRLISAQRRLDDMRETFEATLYKNSQWVAAKKDYDNAEVALGAANGAVRGAIDTACLAVSADIRHGLFGGYPNNYLSYGLPFIAPNSYYGRRY